MPTTKRLGLLAAVLVIVGVVWWMLRPAHGFMKGPVPITDIRAVLPDASAATGAPGLSAKS